MKDKKEEQIANDLWKRVRFLDYGPVRDVENKLLFHFTNIYENKIQYGKVSFNKMEETDASVHINCSNWLKRYCF